MLQTAYVYDAIGRATSINHAGPGGTPLLALSHSYDANGNRTSTTKNDRNEMTRIDYPGLDYVSFAYNDAGARTQMVDSTGTTTYAYDDLYRLTSVTFPGSRTVSYGYDDAGRRTSMTYPGGSNQAAYGYDNANRLTSVTDWGSNVVSYVYDDAGRMTSKTLPSGTGIVSSYTYDNADRLTGISHVKNGSTTVASVSYTLDDVGNRTQRVDQQGTHTYAYDDVYRLTSVTYPGPATTSYAFDAFGNRTSMTVGSAQTTYAYDDADRLTTVTPPSPASAVSYTWDDNGNLTARGSDSFAWDYEDRMTSATVNSTTTTFAYRGDGLRNSRTAGGNTTTFTWDIAAGLPVVIDDGNQYVYGAGLEAMNQGGNWYYYLAGGLGSTVAIVDSSGTVQKSYTYDVYGKPTASGSLSNEFDFAGQQTDSTGLQYLRARYMDPETGTFLSREPMATHPAWTGNHFGYAASDPVRMSDPRGTKPCDAQACEEDAPLPERGPTPPAPIQPDFPSGDYPDHNEPAVREVAPPTSCGARALAQGHCDGWTMQWEIVGPETFLEFATNLPCLLPIGKTCLNVVGEYQRVRNYVVRNDADPSKVALITVLEFQIAIDRWECYSWVYCPDVDHLVLPWEQDNTSWEVDFVNQSP